MRGMPLGKAAKHAVLGQLALPRTKVYGEPLWIGLCPIRQRRRGNHSWFREMGFAMPGRLRLSLIS